MAINRTRSRSSPALSASTLTLQSKPSSASSGWTNNGTLSGLTGEFYNESISDETGIKLTQVRPCNHVRIDVVNHGITMPEFQHTLSGTRYSYRFTGTYGRSAADIPQRSNFSSAIDKFNRRSIRDIIDEIPTSASLPTFLLEIPDIPRTLKSLKDLLELPFEGLNPRKYENFREIRQAKDSLSDPVLGWNFGVVPLWNDITGFLGAQNAVSRRIAELQQTRGRVTKFKKGGTIKGAVYEDAYANIASIGPLTVQGRWSGSSYCKVKVGGTFYHELGGLDSFSSQEAALRASLGLDNLFETAWDIIPFSFLADYVSNIGDLLSELKSNDAFTGEIQLRDTWASTRIVHQGIFSCRFNLPGGKTIGSGTLNSGSRFTFSRSVGIPTSLGLRLNFDISQRELINTIALI